jgi:hypothetical protein
LIGGWDSTTAVSIGDGQCSPQVRLFERGEEYSGPMYRKEGEQCVFARDQPRQPARSIAYRLGGELSPDEFPTMSITLR